MNEICESPLWGLSVERRRTEKWKIFKNFLIFHITRNKNQFGWDLLYLSCWLWSFKVTVSGTLWFPQDRWVPLYQKERLKKVSLLFPPSKMARFLARNLSLTAPEGRVLIGGDWIIPSDSRGNLTAVNPATEQPVSDISVFFLFLFFSAHICIVEDCLGPELWCLDSGSCGFGSSQGVWWRSLGKNHWEGEVRGPAGDCGNRGKGWFLHWSLFLFIKMGPNLFPSVLNTE